MRLPRRLICSLIKQDTRAPCKAANAAVSFLCFSPFLFNLRRSPFPTTYQTSHPLVHGLRAYERWTHDHSLRSRFNTPVHHSVASRFDATCLSTIILIFTLYSLLLEDYVLFTDGMDHRIFHLEFCIVYLRSMLKIAS